MKKLIISVITALVVIVIAYSAGIGYYAEKFQANTNFGNVDISNLTLSEAQAKIEQDIHDKTFTITENGQELGTIQLGELNPELQTEEVLEQTYNSQNPNEWITGYFQTEEHTNALMDNMKLDMNLLNRKLSEIGLSNETRTPATNASIEYSEAQGYYVTEAKSGDQLDLDEVQDLIINGIQNGESTIEVNSAYLEPEVTDSDEEISQVMEEIEKAKATEINLEFAGNSVTIPQEKIEEWIYFDSSNNIVYDEELIYEYLGTLNEKYSTYANPRQFQSTAEGVVTVEPGTLGWSIDRESETQNILADLQAGESVTREPSIVGTGYNTTDGNDIGDSYIEVSVDLQTMWVYVDGELVIETPIVTGQIGTDTVPGAYAIWDKEENATLRGYNPRTEKDYQQPVSYWMPFDDTGQGIHDANWQSNFGGNTYQVSGSLGCINTPPGVMANVFDAAYEGMPVIIH
ncbi:L,D-transpeptidase family protein [Aerococcaceae bacterium WGS1372]